MEGRLLGLLSILLANGLIVGVLATGQPAMPAGISFAVIVAGLAVTHGWLCFFKQHGDPLLLPLAAFLSSIGLMLILRLKPDLILLQAGWTLAGMVLFCLSASLGRRLEDLSRYKYICGIIGVSLLLIPALFGLDIGGNKNWVALGSIRFQPSEFAKLFLLVFLAAYLVERRELLTFSGRQYGFLRLPSLRFTGPLLLLVLLSLLLLVAEKDLGAALLYFGSAVIMVYLACGRLSYVFIALGLFLAGAFFCYLGFPHVQTRVDIWLNPWSDPNGRAFQIVQSLLAIGSGGLMGSGLGWGHPYLIPEVHTDFIFAAIAEEMGLAGATATILAYVLLIYRGFRAAINAPTEFVSLLAGGLAAFQALQTFLIIAGVTKFMPMTGITLPYVSYGGSSMTANFLLLGILFSVSQNENSVKISLGNLMENSLGRNLRRVGTALIGACLVLLLYVSYIQIVQGEELAHHPLNRRAALWGKNTRRGDIVDIQGIKLAESVPQGKEGFQRQYPYGEICSHVVGYNSSRYGQSGVESQTNYQLSGFDSPWRRLGAIDRFITRPIGHTVVLTLDVKLQEAAYKALGNRKGSVVVLNPKTGAILAMVSKPAFNPNTLDKEWDQKTKLSDSPLLNRATQGLYPPGSIIKVLVAEAALADNVASVERRFNCSGVLQVGSDYRLHESNQQVHGSLRLKEALAQSCNVTFGQLALELGGNRLAKSFTRYGLGQTIETDFPEIADHVPDLSRMPDGDLAQMGIGQSGLLVTPLKMAMLAAVFANQGTMMMPHLTERVRNAEGDVLETYHYREWLQPVSQQRAAALTDMMVMTVTEGTGSAARVPGIAVAGKTGTAENAHGAPHAWFIGFAPAERPQIAVAVIVENGGSGGEVAAPVARQIFMKALE